MIAVMVTRQPAGIVAPVLAATVGVAGFLQLSILALRGGERAATPLRVSFDKDMRGFLSRALPGMVASSGPQLLIVAGAIIASHSPSAVSWLYFANRLIELPLGIVGVAMGTVLISELTRALHGADRSAIASAESRALELAAGLALPAMTGLIALSEPIVRLLFEHGAFGASDTRSTAQALIWLALGLPAHVLVKALSPAFFAREDTMAPLLATLKGIVVAVLFAVLLDHFFGASGVAAAIAIGAWSNAASLIRHGRATFGFSLDRAARRRLPRILVAALVMGGLLWLAAGVVTGSGSHRLIQAIVLFALIAAGIAVHGFLLEALGAAALRDLVNAVRSRDLRP
jgi:putative peptidoglycan lipid II flippase